MASTLLSPDLQWNATAKLAASWSCEAKAIVARFPPTNALDTNVWNRCFEELERELLAYSRRKSLKQYLEFLSGFDSKEPWTLGGTWQVGRATRNDRHLVKGDFVLVIFGNGTDRHPVWSVSSKGHRLSGYFCDTNRSGRSATIQLACVPVEYVGQQPTEPDPKLFVSAYAQV